MIVVTSRAGNGKQVARVMFFLMGEGDGDLLHWSKCNVKQSELKEVGKNCMSAKRC